MATETRVARHCFLAIPDQSEQSPVVQTLRKAIADAGFRIVKQVEKSPEASIIGSMAEAIVRADCIVADVTGSSPEVFFELGLAQALDKAAFVVTQDSSLVSLPIDVAGGSSLLHYESSPEGLRQLAKAITSALREFRRFPRRSRFLFGARARSLFVVDWERLNQRDVENLCLELLTQMGFRRVEWEKETPEIDVIAELPKKDPDGFEYWELWLLSLGRTAPPEMLLDMLGHDPEFFVHRMLRFNEKLGPLLKRQQFGDVPITFLLVTLSGVPRQAELFSIEDRPRRRYSPLGNLRFRIWDRNYLTGLVYQFPQIGFKYFSDEGRAQSKYRKTPEELYQENVDLTGRLTTTVAALNDEKNKRVRAERDAIWKDISFSAAHKMGNPIFAIETNLDPLRRRIGDGRVGEAVEVVQRIRNSVEKAKGIVAQFKSLTIAQKIRSVPTRLRALLEEACSVAAAEGVVCSIECPPELHILGDPERLGECFDELVSNAMHWFDKAERKITITVSQPGSNVLADQLDSATTYALIHFHDNGVGVPLENKSKIFDAFFSTYHHGTGLGLALVRRIVEGHGGAVSECGLPGEGADFEIYLPLADQKLPPVVAADADISKASG
ncbi:MAG: ATP-binding protein [Methylocella sp.]